MSNAKKKEVSSSKPDIQNIMAEIRNRIMSEQTDVAKKFEPLVTNPDKNRKAGALVHSEDLRMLNANYASTPMLDLNKINSHRPIIGKFIVKVKRAIVSRFWDLFKEHFAAEREFKKHLVRHLNETSKYVDDRDASNFWEIIRKIDYDVTKAANHIEKATDELDARLRTSERNLFDSINKTSKELLDYITELQGSSQKRETQIKSLSNVTQGLEAIISRISERSKNSAFNNVIEEKEDRNDSVPDYTYVFLENRFRGSEAEIQERIAVYPPYFKTVKKPVLGFGCGRGELLELFNKEGIPYKGVDLDEAMCEEARKKGLDVQCANGMDYMSKLEDSSLGGFVATQVIEHLTREQIDALLKLCVSKVEKGGRVIFETINPTSMLALSSNYFRDPTHVWPLHPDTIEFTMACAGFKVLEIKYLSPVPEEALLKEIETEEFMTPRWQNTVDGFNRNIRQLNSLLYGYQDYAIVAEVA